jgi:hypothetical protein
MRVSPCRRSRICTYQTFSVLQVSRSLPSTTSLVVACRRERSLQVTILAVSYVLMTHTYFGIIASGMLRWAGPYTAGSWVSASLGLTIHTGLADTKLRYIPSRFSAFRLCCFPLWVSPSGRVGVLESHMLSTFCPSRAIQYVPKRRTSDGP